MSGDIKYTYLVTSPTSSMKAIFILEVQEMVKDAEDLGYTVEINYGINNHIYSAFIIGREK